MKTVFLPKSFLSWLFRVTVACPVFLLMLLHLTTSNSYSAEVSLSWDPVVHSDLAGYKIFSREEFENYDYLRPVWVGDKTTRTVRNLEQHNNYCFVVRAFDIFGNESDESNEVCWPPSSDSNMAPLIPNIASPYPGQHECELTPTLETESFSDPDNDLHLYSRWQISETQDPSSLLLAVNSSKHLSSLPVPLMVLREDTRYYARVQHYDIQGEPSGWSNWVEFSTSTTNSDLNGDGIPDEQEVEYGVDLNEDGIDDALQPHVIKSVKSIDKTASIGISGISKSIESIETVANFDPSTTLQDYNEPGDMLFDLFAYRLVLNQLGGTAKVKIYFSEEVPQGYRFHKYDSVRGWSDYSQHSSFSKDRRSVTVELKDGDYGDVDGVANGIIVDPSALVFAGSSSAADMGIAASSCFISTAAFDSLMDK